MLSYFFGRKSRPLRDQEIYTINFVERFQDKAEDDSWNYDLYYKTWWVAEKINNTDQYRLARKSILMNGSSVFRSSKVPQEIREKFHKFTEYTITDPITSRDGRRMMSKEEAIRELEHLEQKANTCETIHDIARSQDGAKFHFTKFMEEMGLQPATTTKPATETPPNTPLRLKTQEQKR